jgi:serine/threonine protein kinase
MTSPSSPDAGASQQGDAPDLRRVEDIFAAALATPPADRAAYLDRVCGVGTHTRRQVEALLSAAVNADRARFLVDPPERATEPAPPSAAGGLHRIGHYAVRRIIGAGGMGTVYEALQEHPRRVVAVKVMRHGLGSSGSEKRFQREAELLGRLHHPGIAQIFEAGTFEDPGAPPPAGGRVPFFAMEYIPGARSITDFAREHDLTIPQRLDLFARVCDAVHHGHVRGIIHRDLKPSNILVDTSSGSPQPKIIDFGVARATDSDLSVSADASASSHLVGTLQYMSPEQAGAVDAGEIDARSDVYSLGVILYELLCGRLPYEVAGCSIGEAIRRIRHQPPPDPSAGPDADPSLRGDLASILRKALHKDRDQRFHSAHDLAHSIRLFLAGEPLPDLTDSLTYVLKTRARRWVGSHRIAARLLAVAVTAIVMQTAGVWLLFRLTPANAAVERWMMALLPAPVPGFEHVRMALIDDQTPFADLARQGAGGAGGEGGEGRDGVPQELLGHPRLPRFVHGRLMERLAAVSPPGPAAVVWDIQFLGDTPFDDAFVRGARALEARSIPVVAVSATWTQDEPALAPISAAIREAVRFGAATGYPSAGEPWKVELALQRSPVEFYPSLVLAAYAAVRAENGVARLSFDLDYNRVNVGYWRAPATDRPRSFQVPVRPHEAVNVTSTFRQETDDHDAGLRAGDRIAVLTLALPDDAAIAKATIPYGRLFEMSDAELRQAVAGCYVLFGDARATSEDKPRPTPDGRLLHPLVAHATALATLLSGAVVRMPGGIEEWAIVGGGAALGAVLPIRRRHPNGAGFPPPRSSPPAMPTSPSHPTPPSSRLRARRARRAALGAVAVQAAAAALVITAACILALRAGQFLCNPLMPVLSLILATTLAAAIDRARAPKLSLETLT